MLGNVISSGVKVLVLAVIVGIGSTLFSQFTTSFPVTPTIADAMGLTAAFQLRDRLAVEEVAVDHDGTLELAATTGLTAYDASYLWLARQLGAELVTLDKQLAKAQAASLLSRGSA